MIIKYYVIEKKSSTPLKTVVSNISEMGEELQFQDEWECERWLNKNVDWLNPNDEYSFKKIYKKNESSM